MYPEKFSWMAILYYIIICTSKFYVEGAAFFYGNDKKCHFIPIVLVFLQAKKKFMNLFEDIFKFRSVSIVGMEKNTGKTECLKYILGQCAADKRAIGITSIGLDGESCDQVTGTAKPEISLSPGDIFVTSEKHYQERKLVAEILDISKRRTAFGRLVTAKVICAGKVILSGPTGTQWLRETIDNISKQGVQTTFVDGALSRKSLGSPAVTESMILTTGAALSPNLNELVRKTKYVYSLINLEKYETSYSNTLLDLESGMYAIADEQIHDLNIESALLIGKNKQKLFQYGHTLFAGGIIGDNLLDTLRLQPEIEQTTLIVKDFTKIFVSPVSLNAFLKKGGQLKVLLRPHLICVCVNPLSPAGYLMDSAQLRETLSEALGTPVYDIKKMQY